MSLQNKTMSGRGYGSNTASNAIATLVREAEKANIPFVAALPGALRRCSSLVWLATRLSERLALHPASAPKNGILAISASLSGSVSTPVYRALRALILGPVAAAALLAGCQNLVPHYERPVAPVAASFPGEAASATAATPAAEIEWRQFFKDARLKRLIELSLQNNRDLRLAVLNIEQTRAQLGVRRADELPTVNVGATGSRVPSTSGGISSTYTAGFSVTAYELDFFGRVRALSQAAQALLLGSEEARKTVHISLIASVANSYLSLLADEEGLRLTRESLRTREASLKLTQLKFDNGAASQLDVSQAASLLESAKVTLAQLTRQRAQDENALVLLVGQPESADSAADVAATLATNLPNALPNALSSALPNPLPDALPDALPGTSPVTLPGALPLGGQALVPDLPASLPSDLLVRRPDVRQAEQQLLANNANIGAARAAFFPRITLTGSVGLASTDLGRLFTNGALAWTFAPQLLLPIFDAGRNQANLEAAQVNRDIAVAQYEKAIQTAFREVADALAGRATLGEQLRAQAAQLKAEETRMQLTDLRYRNGAASYFDILDAQRSLFTAQQALVQVQALQVQNLVTLYKVLGGGWKDAAPVR